MARHRTIHLPGVAACRFFLRFVVDVLRVWVLLQGGRCDGGAWLQVSLSVRPGTHGTQRLAVEASISHLPLVASPWQAADMARLAAALKCLHRRSRYAHLRTPAVNLMLGRVHCSHDLSAAPPSTESSLFGGSDGGDGLWQIPTPVVESPLATVSWSDVWRFATLAIRSDRRGSAAAGHARANRSRRFLERYRAYAGACAVLYAARTQFEKLEGRADTFVDSAAAAAGLPDVAFFLWVLKHAPPPARGAEVTRGAPGAAPESSEADAAAAVAAATVAARPGECRVTVVTGAAGEPPSVRIQARLAGCCWPTCEVSCGAGGGQRALGPGDDSRHQSSAGMHAVTTPGHGTFVATGSEDKVWQEWVLPLSVVAQARTPQTLAFLKPQVFLALQALSGHGVQGVLEEQRICCWHRRTAADKHFLHAMQVAAHRSAFLSAEDTPLLHAAARHRAARLMAQPPAAPPVTSTPPVAMLRHHTARRTNARRPPSPSHLASPSTASPVKPPCPFHISVAATIDQCTLHLLSEPHPGVADAAARPAAARRRRAAPRAQGSEVEEDEWEGATSQSLHSEGSTWMSSGSSGFGGAQPGLSPGALQPPRHHLGLPWV
jgi:hypothetical protein